MSPPVKTLNAAHTIISLSVLATGRLLLATEKRVYELVDNVWQPMAFADDPEPDAVAEPTPLAPVTPVEHTPAPAVTPAADFHPVDLTTPPEHTS